MARVKRPRRRKDGLTPGFEEDPRHAVRARRPQKIQENPVGQSAPPHMLPDMHRLQLARRATQPLQRPHGDGRLVLEDREKPGTGLCQPFGIHGMHATRRARRAHQRQMGFDQGRNARVSRVCLVNDGGQWVHAPRRSVAKFSP